MRILHIEDRPENRLLVRKVLESKGHTVTDAAEGLVGLELARNGEFELILVDINIPNINGYEVVTRLRTEVFLDRTPIVAITAEGDREHALALGFDAFIQKPIKMSSFEAELKSIIAGDKVELDEHVRLGHLRRHSQSVVDKLEMRVRELERANRRLRDVDRLKMEVFRNVSHELATPLTPMVGYLRMLDQGELGPLTDRQLDIVKRLEHSTMRLKRLIDDLLSATRLATGTMRPNLISCQPDLLVRQAVEGWHNAAHTRGLKLNLNLNGACTAFLDSDQCLRAFSHIVDNAVKFSPAGASVSVTTRTESSGEGRGRIWAVSVADEGPGIPLTERLNVLEPFYQIDGSVTRAHGGAGLGLAISARVVTAHEGTLDIQDNAHTGVIVTVRLPIREAPAGQSASSDAQDV
ncbi:MAG: ATP-binding protein [Bradymonadia bacterium]